MNDGHVSGCLPLPHSSWCLLFFLQVHWNSQMWRETVPFPGLAVGLSALSCSVRSWVSRKMPRDAQGLPREDVPIARPSHWLYWRSWPSPGLLSVFICEISHLGDTASRFPFSFYVPWFSLLNKPEMFLRLIKTTGEVLFYSIIWKTASQQDRGVCGGLIRFLPHTSLKKFSET